MHADAFELPAGAEFYVALQRTAYQHPVNRWFRRFGMGARYDALLLPHIEKRRRPQIARQYRDEMARDYAALRPHLPVEATRILDIGCGLAGIEVFLHSHYAKTECRPEIHLFDKTEVTRIHYGLEAEGAFYNSLDLAVEFLASNGVDRGCLHTHDAGEGVIPDGPWDLVLSLISWGFHYPVSTYLDQVHEQLADDGRLILDTRSGFDGRPLLETRFARVEPIFEGPGFTRVLATK